MHTLIVLADLSIRRACGFMALAIATVMVALSFDLVASLRFGADLTAILWLGLLVAAWRAPRRNMRHSELWSLAADHAAFVRHMPRDRAQALLSGVLRARLLWHAERVAVAAVGLYAAAGLMAALRS